ncbi:UDP-N-acetylmuramate--L-alanine ligase [uncultured Clostridium sp.]|uniref:Mur ligase family protein n=1 Tax=uncultured Clostridium sp. TaxID=59620 RepID=UPI000820D90A|nr:Mur ligase family protein [uncultured Clostridium sp.]SCJ73989.1 UDP-N-acetylmuramate--L-alanine ligase [uncultured Clostridium sp.]
MSKISIKSIISILATKFTIFLTKTILKGGTTFPGKVALKLDKDILTKVASGYNVILVTGTNGKTTTTSMIYNILKEKGFSVITNNTGANLYSGIVTTFVDNYKFSDKNHEKFAVIEVDEANVKFITEKITPNIITVTNLFRDQLDRYGEVYTTLTKILEGVYSVPTSKLILNGDESLLGKLDIKNPVVFYGFKTNIDENKTIDINADAKFCKFCKTPYKYNFVTYNHLGDYYCTGCGYKRPEISYGVDEIIDLTSESSTVKINDTEIFLSQSGVYNIYNALCAYSIAKELGVNDLTIKKSLENQSSSFGRQETINIEDKEVKIILVKNPAGYNQALDTLCLSKDPFSAAFILNDNYADGRDVSWIWDVNFEHLNNVDLNEIYVSGLRSYDMAVRLKTAGLDSSKFSITEEYDALTERIKESNNKKVYILATYTAMINYRKHLHSKGYIKNLW